MHLIALKVRFEDNWPGKVYLQMQDDSENERRYQRCSDAESLAHVHFLVCFIRPQRSSPYVSRQDFICSSLTVARFAQVHCNAFMHAPSFFGQKSTNGIIEQKLAVMPIPQNLCDLLLPVFRDLHILADMSSELSRGICGIKFMAFTQVISPVTLCAWWLELTLVWGRCVLHSTTVLWAF